MVNFRQPNRRDTENSEVAQRDLSNFSEFPRIWKTRLANEEAEQGESEESLPVCSLHLAPLKPDRDSTTNRPSSVAEEGQDLSVIRTCLSVQQVARVENGFSSY